MPRKKPGEISIDGEPRKPVKVGKTTTVDMETGKVTSVKSNAMTLLPCKPGVCQECAVDHPFSDPHNAQSLYYQYRFHATHGRWPTWTDAMAHCPEAVKDLWRPLLIEGYRRDGMPIPDDLLEPRKGTR